MAEQTSVNSQTVEQTKQQIRNLVSEIAQLSKSDMTSEEYYAAFMQRIVSALAAIGGAIWLLTDGNRPKLGYQINLSDTLLDPTSDDAVQHFRLLDHIVRGGEPQLIPPLAGNEEQGGNPSRYLLVLAPLLSEGKVEGVVEIFQRPDGQPATQRGYLRFLVQMCELAGEWLKSQKLKQFSDRHSLWEQADHFARLVHDTLDLRETCYTISNEGRRMVGCDRISVAVKRGAKCKVEAVSGQDTLENRSNIIAALNLLATRVVATGEPLYYDGSTADLAPQVEEAIDSYVDESYGKSVYVLPMRRPDRDDMATDKHAEPTHEVRDRECIGALIVEQIESDIPREVLEPRVDLVYEHSARSLANSLDHNNMFLMPVWKTLGKATFVLKARTLPKTLAISAIILVVLTCLFFVPKNFDLQAKGKLQPVERREVFVNIDGDVIDVPVKHGQVVKAGDVLARLRNTDLEVQRQDTAGKIRELEQQIRAFGRLLNTGQLGAEEKTRVFGQKSQFEQQLDTQLKTQKLLAERLTRLEVTSPIDGTVVTWDVKEMLQGRTVAAGQVLMTVADTTQDWELEVFMPERRMGHIMTAQKEIKEDLDVTYILATDPGQDYHGNVHEVHRSTQQHEVDGHSVMLRVNIDKSELKQEPRPGTSVTVDVACGRRPIGYCWFHEAWEWVQANVLF